MSVKIDAQPSTSAGTSEWKLTGWHVLAIFCSCFAVIIGVNIALAVNAVRSFPGLEVKNSYVASQTYDDRRAAQEALGWDVAAAFDGEAVTLSIRDSEGKPVQAGKMQVLLGRATHMKDDSTPEFAFNGHDYVAYVDLAPGNWNLRIDAHALDGTAFQQRVPLHVKS